MSKLQQLREMFENNKVGFLNVVGYTNSKGEVADHLTNVGYKYGNFVKRDLVKVNNANIEELISKGSNKGFDAEMVQTAYANVLKSIVSPNKKMSDAQKNSTTSINKSEGENSLVYCFNTENVLIQAMKIRKTIKVSANTTDTRRPLTKCQDWIKNELKLSNTKIRRFKFKEENINELHYANKSITLHLI